MNDGVTKRIVVLRNLPSNVIEEAILILKSDPAQKKDTFNEKGKVPRKTGVDNNFLLKEAHMIVNDYIEQSNLQSVPKNDYKKVPLFKNRKFMTNTIINIALISSIAIFIFMLSRLF